MTAETYAPAPEGAGPMYDGDGDIPVLDTPRSWRPIDLDQVLDGSWEPARPTVGQRTDGTGMFYPGKVHTISSESEAGKTWMALSAVVDELVAGNHVVYIDFEDDQGGVTSRLLALQVQRDLIRSHFHYVRPVDPLGTGINLDDLRDLIVSTKPTLCVIDGVTEAMTMHGLDPLNNKEIAVFGRILPRRVAAAGIATVCLDHVTKVRDGSNRYALGGVHKLNGLDGAAYLLENRTAFGIGLTGRSTIKISKDRPAQLRKHSLPSSGGLHWYGDLVLTSHNADFAELTIEPPTEVDSTDFRPTAVMAKLWRLIDRHQGTSGLSGRNVQDLAKGKAATNRQALVLLTVDGYITPTPHKTLKPYPPEGATE